MQKRQKRQDRSAEETVRLFYDAYGWQKVSGETTFESVMFRRFPAGYADYAPGPIKRLLDAFSAYHDRLLIVGCGDMPPSHVKIAQGFRQVQCLDISIAALAVAKDKVGNNVELTHGSIVDTGITNNSMDAILCSHVLFHIDKAQQEQAVRQMLRITRPGGRVVILYANPRSPMSLPGEILRSLKRMVGFNPHRQPNGLDLYYHAYPLSWWRRFEDQSNVTLAPSDVIGSRVASAFLRPDAFSVAFYRCAARLENAHPNLALKLWQYPMVVLDKRSLAPSMGMSRILLK